LRQDDLKKRFQYHGSVSSDESVAGPGIRRKRATGAKKGAV
jgi:hypothetical protein